MIDAKLLLTTEEETTYDVWGVWIPRKGDNAILTVEMVENYLADVTFAIYEKNYDDPGNGNDSGVSTSFDAETGCKNLTLTGSKELIRVKITVARNKNLGSKDVGNFLFRFLQPVWFEAVA